MMGTILWKCPLSLFQAGVFMFLTNSLIAQSRDFVADASILGNDPRFHDQPVFVQEPEDSYYIVKSKPITVTCKAINTARIKFKCAEQWIDPMSRQNIVDTNTNRKILAASIEVVKDDVEEYFGGSVYWCECYGYKTLSGDNDDYDMMSKKGEIEIAYLRKTFERRPIPVRVSVSEPAVLSCLPPEGKPLPEVFWLKDGEEIDVKNEKNYIIAHNGDLLINQAALSNMGNYTCGARNKVTRRLSLPPVPLTVYVNGSWSSWSRWSECSTKCGKGYQRRQRTCSNPAPINGGAACPGEKIQRLECSNLCPVDGGWTEWSSWSTCSPECVHHRTRSCARPAPREGGSYCRGSDLDGANCTGGMCRDRRHYGNYPHNAGMDQSEKVTRTEEQGKENMVLYIGLCVGIVIFGIVVVVFVLIIRRSTLRHRDLGGASSPEEEKMNKNSTDLSSVPPDLTQVVMVPHHSTSPSPVDMPNNNYAPFENIYDKPDINISTSDTRHSLIKNGNTVIVEPSINLDRSLTDMSVQDARNLQIATPGGLVSPNGIPTNENLTNSRLSMTSVQLPSNIETEAVTWGTFNHLGGRLVLPESGVSLTIPEGAVKKGSHEELFLGICRDDKDRPKLSDRQTIVSPVIVCGPQVPGMLKKAIILSFQHCANMRQGGWMLTLCNSDAPPEDPPQWKKTVTLGQETINTQVYTQLDPNQCHVMTETLSWYTVIGEAVPNGRPVKILRLAAFAPMTPPSMDFSIRVYVVEDTQDALEGVVQEERKFGGRLLDKPKQIPFQDGGHNLCLTIEGLSPGWRSKLAANYQEIPFQHIWSGNQNSLHCSFSLELVDRAVQDVSCKIQVYQKAILSNRQVLHIQSHYKDKVPAVCSTPSSTLKGRSSTVTTNSSSGFSSMVALDPHGTNFRLPPHIRSQLCMLLDPPNVRGNDWRMLAQALTVDRYIQYFATKSSPTEHILNLWEARHREESAITDLMNIFRVMGRMDAAAVIEKDIGSWL